MPGHHESSQVLRMSSRTVKPDVSRRSNPLTATHIPLTVFDRVTYNGHIAVLYAFRPPTPSTLTLESGLARALAEYREFAGRLGDDTKGNPVILLNDKGVKFLEASVDSALDKYMPYKPSPALLSLHPSLVETEELVQIQVTRFACGTMVIGFTAHHLVADGHATSNFLIAWGLAARGIALNQRPSHDRALLFAPRDPPLIEFNHGESEFMAKDLVNRESDVTTNDDGSIVVQKVHFTKEFLTSLKEKANSSDGQCRYTTFETLVAHLWRATTCASGIDCEETFTQLRISVNGRMRMRPRVPDEYFGNLVLWAFPRARACDLLSWPLRRTAGLIRDEVARVDDRYFRSFIDFAKSGAVERDELVPTADMCGVVMSPNLEVDSWLRFPFYDVDFGGGCPYYFTPTYYAVEGMLLLLPSFVGDGSVDAFVGLFRKNVEYFKQICYLVD